MTNYIFPNRTAVIKLLMRFYDVNSGSIKIDGHDVRDFNRSEQLFDTKNRYTEGDILLWREMMKRKKRWMRR